MEKIISQKPRAVQLSKKILVNLHQSFGRALDSGKVHPWAGARSAGIRYVPEVKVSSEVYWATVRRMKKQGWIKETPRPRQRKKFLTLTKKGKVQALLSLMQEHSRKAKPYWDKKWRVAIFDIPEKEGRHERYKIRDCLKACGFYCLQKSVYIHPHEISRHIIDYLSESGLNKFIRFLRVDRIDDSRELERHFKLRKLQKKRVG